MENVTRFGISLPMDVLKEYDEIIKKKGYSNRSKAIQDLVREFIKKETTGKKVNHVIAVRYNHRHIKDISEIENNYPCTVISSLNFHLDLNNSYKILTLYGDQEQADKIVGKYKELGDENRDMVIQKLS